MTKEQKMVQSWVHALPETAGTSTQTEIEFDVVDQLAAVPRVIYLNSKGYKITNWAEYAQAEINEMGLTVEHK